MKLTYWTLAVGILFVIVGIMGFVPQFLQSPELSDPSLAVDHNYGRLLGVFPVNVLHNIVHLILGVWALAASRRFESAQVYCKAAAWIYGVMAVMGLIPGLNTMFGLIPIHSHDVWLHAGLAALLAYLGFYYAKLPAAHGQSHTGAIAKGF
jgi:hypothetical protein